ncbi:MULTISPECIES: hypothetical protein [Pseudomonas syringae group]|nr:MULTISPECIES: hypothetical protein [Pseudomonas syringae group]RMU69604.1 hypothetical protein ALP24_200129 [Pseudomonas syringae pv. aptata]
MSQNIPMAPVMPSQPPLPPPPPLTTHQVASGIAKWAISCGLLSQLPPGVDDQFLAQIAPISFSTEAESLLRHKEIQSISYNQITSTISIYTKRKVIKKDLQVLPSNIWRQGIAYPQGLMDSVGKEATKPQGATFALHQIAGGHATYACGSSISPGNDASAGTMGALVRLPDGLLYGLTNNHVSALCSHVAPNTPILAPGVLDVGPNAIAPFTLGFHSRALEMRVGSLGNVDFSNNLDAAVFRIADEANVSSMQGGAYDTPLVVLDPVEGMRVQKVGRTTRHTQGQIVSRELRPLNVSYHAQSYGFNGMIWFGNVFAIHGDNAEFSKGGDSGSLIVAVDDAGLVLGAVGLIFAGGSDSSAPGGYRSSMLPLQPILTALNATLVGGHNV